VSRTLLNRIVVRLLVVALAPALLVSAAVSAPMIELRREHLLTQAAVPEEEIDEAVAGR